MEKTWKKLSDRAPLEKQPIQILNHFAKKLAPDTNGEFIGIVTDSIRDDTSKVTYALYIAVPKLRNYMYRLFEVEVPSMIDPYPVTITHFAVAAINTRTYACNTPIEFQKKLNDLIDSSLTQTILSHLETLIEINEDDRKL